MYKIMRSIVLSHRQERDSLLAKAYQPREYQDTASTFMKSSLIKLITGPRRAGKSVFALMLLKKENFAYLNFDDENRGEYHYYIKNEEDIIPSHVYLALYSLENSALGYDSLRFE